MEGTELVDHYIWQSGMFQQTDMMETFTSKAEKREPKFDDLGKVDDSGVL